MFGPFSFSHIAVLVVLVFVIYRWSRRNAVRARGSQAGGQNNGQGNAPRANAGNRGPVKPANAQQKVIEDLVKCPSCGTYIAAGSSCGCGQARR